MQAVTFLIAVAALVIAILALARTGGIDDLRRRVEGLGPQTAGLRDRTANTLVRVAQRLRRDKAPPGPPPGSAGPPEPPDPV